MGTAHTVSDWAAMGCAVIIGSFFFKNNLNGESYLKMLKTQFIRKFGKLKNSDQLVFMQDGAPPHWSTNVRKWLNENLPGRWIGRGGPQDCNVTWPPRSPDMTPMDYFLWGFIRSKVYVKNYENISELKGAIISAFQEVSDRMVTLTMDNFDKRKGNGPSE